jgi:hypothetical protein
VRDSGGYFGQDNRRQDNWPAVRRYTVQKSPGLGVIWILRPGIQGRQSGLDSTLCFSLQPAFVHRQQHSHRAAVVGDHSCSRQVRGF